jgi:hypothetical protein
MPVIPRAAPKPLPPEGPFKGHVYDVTYGRSKEKQTPFFELSIRDLATGLTWKDRLYLTPTTGWKIDACCESMGHKLPAGQYRVNTDDFLNRIVFGTRINRPLPSGQVTCQTKSYWKKTYAIQQEPHLAELGEPAGLSGPLDLPLVEEPAAPMPPPPPPVTPPPVTPPPPPPASGTPPPAAKAKAPEPEPEAGGITDEELAEAMAYAKKLRAAKNKPPGE